MTTQNETYYPKILSRIHPKKQAGGMLSLRELAMDAVLQSLFHAKGAAPGARNARDRKGLRQYLNENLPRQLQEDFFQYAVTRWISSKRLVKILDAFEPQTLIKDSLNLIGSFRYAYGCYYSNGRLYWSNGTIERLNLSRGQCDRLYNYLIWSDAFKKKMLTTLAISTERGVLQDSKLPSLLARSPNLVAVTILNGVTDHVMRILGLNCPNLKLLDISHSNNVSNAGVRNLLMKNPKISLAQNAFETLEKNPCASSIFKMIIIGTGIDNEGINFACRLMGNNSAHLCFLPDVMIVRPTAGQVACTTILLNSNQALDAFTKDEGIQRGLNLIAVRFADRRRGVENRMQALDIFVPPTANPESQLFLKTIGSSRCEAMMTTRKWNTNDTLFITQLTLCWDSFTWNVSTLPDITEMGVALPNLEVLKARVQGVWERGTPLFPFLKETFVWTVMDATVMSFLAHCPKIETFKFHCLNLLTPTQVLLTDETFAKTLLANPSLVSSITELCLRPAPKLTLLTAQVVINSCPSLRRLGDLESWKVSNEDIKELNRLLDSKNSAAVLTVLSFPPKEKHSYLI